MSDSATALLWALAIFALPGIIIAARLLRRVKESGGNVRVASLGLPDLLVSFFLCGYFALLVVAHAAGVADPARGAAPELKAEQIIPNMVFFLGIIALVLGLLRVRRISPVELFGLRRWPFWRGALVGALIVAAIYPIMHAFAQAVQMLLQEGAREQEVVKLYRQVAKSGDSGNLALLIFVAVIFQPIVEETIFRGYFYATFKGWAGALASAIFTATLFAAIHVNLVAFPALLVLALVLTLAYEWSGSLWVPIAMHMTFNGLQLAIFTWVQNLQPA